MPTIKFWNPASDAERLAQLKLKAAEHELALREDNGRDLVAHFSWEKDLRKEVEKKCASLQQEHLKLQDEHTAYVLAAARAEQANEELHAKLQDLQEELFNVEVARDSNWEDNRQALLDNNRLTLEVEALKAKVAAMHKAQSMMPAQQNTQSTLKFPLAMPFERVSTVVPTISSAQVKRASFAGLSRSPLSNISNTQVLYDEARPAGFGLSPLGNVSNTQGIGRLQAKRTTPTPLSLLGLGTSPLMRPESALLRENSHKIISDYSPAIKASYHALHTPVVTPKADFLLPTPTSATTGLFQPPAVGAHSLWARSPSIDSQAHRDMFRDASSCGSDCEKPAPASTPRPSLVVEAGSSHSRKGNDNLVSPDSLRDGSICHNNDSGEDGAALTPPNSINKAKVGSRHSSSGEDSPATWPSTASTHPLSTLGAVMAVPALAKAGEVEYLRWRYRCTDGSLSCLGSLDCDEASPEALQRLQSAQSSTPPAPPFGNPKYLTRQEALEEHWGYGHSSCNDSGSDVSAVSGCTICSGARWSPAPTASSPAQSTGSPDSNTLHLETAVSYGELNFEVHRLLLDSPLSTASVKSLCPMPGAMATPHAQLSPAPEAACHTSSATANIVRSTSGAGTVAVEDGPTPSSVKVISPSTTAAAPNTTATACYSCKATASPSTAEARGSSVQSGRAAAPRSALRTSSAAGEPVQRGALHHQPTTATAVTPTLQPAHPAASSKSMSVSGKKAAYKRMQSTPVPAAAGVTTRRQAAAAAAAGVTTRGQAAAAAQHKTMPTSGLGAASSKPRQARSLKPEAPTRRQPQRAAKPQWR